jgi:FemAB-related protein (PEP-CTERM system-associated)
MFEVRELTEALRPAWDQFVTNSPAGLPTHLSAWQDVLVETYGYETRFMLYADGDDIRGVMPLFHVNSPVLGRTATTMPGGLCAGEAQAASALIHAGLETAQGWGSNRFRLHDTRQSWLVAGLRTTTHHEHWLVDTDMSAEQLWSALDGNIRRQVRKARKNGLEAEIDRTGRLLDPFYELFSRFVHGMGTPAFGRDFLETVITAFPERYNICLVRQGEEVVAGYFQFESGAVMSGMWGGALPEYLPLRPVYLGLWTVLEEAAGRGFQCLDMGRSPAKSNASRFKGQWGGTSAPIHQQVCSVGRDKAKQSDPIATGLKSDNMTRMMKWWPRLPYPVAQFIGPHLRRHIPFG